MAHYTLGVDVGTSGVKAALLDLDTFRLGSAATRSYNNAPQQASAMLREATAAAIREAVAGMYPRAIRSISISGQMHGTVMYDAVGAGKGLQNSRVWAQMAADVFDRPIKITDFENGVWGAALIAAVGAGAISDTDDALATMEYSREFAQDPMQAVQYKNLNTTRATNSVAAGG